MPADTVWLEARFPKEGSDGATAHWASAWAYRQLRSAVRSAIRRHVVAGGTSNVPVSPLRVCHLCVSTAHYHAPIPASRILGHADIECVEAYYANFRKTDARHRVFPQIAAHLPPDFDPSYLIPAVRTPVPEPVRKMIADMVEAARYNKKTYDDVSQSCSENFNARTAQTYSVALVALARAAQDTGAVELASLNCLDSLFETPVRIAAIRHWIDQSETDAGCSLRTAADYVRIVAQIGKANGLKTKKWLKSLKKNPHLKEGHASGEKMSAKNRTLCEGLIHNPADVRTYLRQHVLYHERAKDILATDKVLTKTQLRDARRLATCAAFSALEIRGAGLRKGSALAAEISGTGQNLFRKTTGEKKFFELRVAQKDMKGEYVELPPIHIRDDKYCGYEVIDWYLTTGRPLFDFANPEFCKEKKCARATHLFVSEQSANPLGGKMLYKWLTRSSAESVLSSAIEPWRLRCPR